jgi:hypothetical protein
MSPRTAKASPHVARLIERIRKLVAEQRRLERATDGKRLESLRRDIARLHAQLANVVKRELDQASPALFS